MEKQESVCPEHIPATASDAPQICQTNHALQALALRIQHSRFWAFQQSAPMRGTLTAVSSWESSFLPIQHEMQACLPGHFPFARFTAKSPDKGIRWTRAIVHFVHDPLPTDLHYLHARGLRLFSHHAHILYFVSALDGLAYSIITSSPAAAITELRGVTVCLHLCAWEWLGTV